MASNYYIRIRMLIERIKVIVESATICYSDEDFKYGHVAIFETAKKQSVERPQLQIHK